MIILLSRIFIFKGINAYKFALIVNCMNIKIKKLIHKGRIIRMGGSGDVRDIVINENLLNPKESSVSLFFRGENSSGILELTPKEVEILNKEVASKIHLFKDITVLKFKK